MISLSFLHNSINKSLKQGKSHHVGKVTTHCLPLMHPYHEQLHNQGWRASWCHQEYPPSIGMFGEWYAILAWVVVTLKILEATTTSDMATILLCVPLGHINRNASLHQTSIGANLQSKNNYY
jgi:hypothetical protein